MEYYLDAEPMIRALSEEPEAFEIRRNLPAPPAEPALAGLRCEWECPHHGPLQLCRIAGQPSPKRRIARRCWGLGRDLLAPAAGAPGGGAADRRNQSRVCRALPAAQQVAASARRRRGLPRDRCAGPDLPPRSLAARGCRLTHTTGAEARAGTRKGSPFLIRDCHMAGSAHLAAGGWSAHGLLLRTVRSCLPLTRQLRWPGAAGR